MVSMALIIEWSKEHLFVDNNNNSARLSIRHPNNVAPSIDTYTAYSIEWHRLGMHFSKFQEFLRVFTSFHVGHRYISRRSPIRLQANCVYVNYVKTEDHCCCHTGVQSNFREHM